MAYVGYVTFTGGHGYSFGHNRRDQDYMKRELENFRQKQEKLGEKNPKFHIDFEKTKENEILVDRDLREIYETYFQPAVDAYDEKNRAKHPERVKGDYLKYVRNHMEDKNAPKPCYEIIIQFGDKNTTADSETRNLCASALKNYVRIFERENPHLKIVGAYLHMDEASPHVHLDYVPVATSNRGLTVKNSRSQALKQQEQERLEYYRKHEPDKAKEYEKTIKTDKWGENPTTRWQARQRDNLRYIGERYGLITEKMSKPLKVEHLETEEYRLQKNVKELRAEQKRLSRENEITVKNAGKVALDIMQEAERKAETIIRKAEERSLQMDIDYQTKKERNRELDISIADKEREEERLRKICKSYKQDIYMLNHKAEDLTKERLKEMLQEYEIERSHGFSMHR